MERKKLTRTLMMISKNPLVSMVSTEIFQRCEHTDMSTRVDILCFYCHLYNQLLEVKYVFNLETLMAL